MKTFFLTLLFSVSVYGESLITVKEFSYVSRPNVKIADVVTFSGIAKNKIHKLLSSDLATAMQEGEIRKFSHHALSQIFRKQLITLRKENAELKDLKLKIPHSIEINYHKNPITEENISNKIKNAMAELCTNCQLEVIHLNLPALRDRNYGEWSMDIPQRLLRGNFSIPMRIEVYSENGSRIRSFWVNGRIRIQKRVAVFKTSMQAGKILGSSDYSMELRDITRSHEIPSTEDQIKGARLKRRVTEGDIVWFSFIEPEKAVQRGRLIDIISKDDLIEIRMRGIAKQDGFVGEVISVLNTDSKKTLQAKVIEKGKVEVQ